MAPRGSQQVGPRPPSYWRPADATQACLCPSRLPLALRGGDNRACAEGHSDYPRRATLGMDSPVRNVGGWSAAVYAVDAKEAGSRAAHAYKGDDVVEIVEDRLALKLLICLEPSASEEVLRIVARILVTDQFDSCRQRQAGKAQEIQDPERLRITGAVRAALMTQAQRPGPHRGVDCNQSAMAGFAAAHRLGPQNLVHRLPLC